MTATPEQEQRGAIIQWSDEEARCWSRCYQEHNELEFWAQRLLNKGAGTHIDAAEWMAVCARVEQALEEQKRMLAARLTPLDWSTSKLRAERMLRNCEREAIQCADYSDMKSIARYMEKVYREKANADAFMELHRQYAK